MNVNHPEEQTFLKRLTTVVEANLSDENFSVEKLAELAGLSRSMLHRRLIKLTGKSATELITETKLEKAKDLLMKGDFTSAEIAYKVGFSSPSYFNKVFRKHFNQSPGEVRKKSIQNHVQTQKWSVEEWSDHHDKKRFGFKQKLTIWSIVAILVVAVAIAVYNRIYLIEKSIAVLPLYNLTGQPENDFFAEGMHDAIIGELGKLSNLRVISRTSTLRYHDSDMLLKDIANELRVNIIVEASLVSVGDSLKLLIQLIDVLPKERHLLSTEYNDEMKNVLKIHSLVVKDIAQKINLKITKGEEERLKQSRTVDPETYKAYLRGMYHISKGTPEAFEKGINYLHEAIEKDPGDPFAYAALALGYANIGHGQLNAKEAFNRATTAAKTAIKIDPTIDEAYTALAILHLYQSWDWPQAKEAFENAIKQNPNNEIAHAHFAWYHVLFSDFDKAIYHGKKAAELNPLYVSYSTWLALLYYSNKQYNEAEHWAKLALELKENTPYGNLVMGWVNLHREKYDEAIAFHEKLPISNYYNVMRGYAYLKAGQKERAMELWKEMEELSKTQSINSCYRGFMAAYLGFTDKSFELLNEAFDKKQYPIAYINFYPYTEDIRNDPRYDRLLRKLNLPHEKVLMVTNW